ncbi:MAG: hypothetical protein AB1571_03990 [Nanoarchaeota archaeon]
MPIDFAGGIAKLQETGMFEVVLPFLLVFAIVFAILEKTKILGTDETAKKPKTNINVVVSLVIGLLLVLQTEIVQIINNFLPKISLVIIVVLMFLIVLGIFNPEAVGTWGGIPLFFAVILTILAVAWSLTPVAGWQWPYWFTPTDQDLAIIILLAVIIAVIYLIVRQPKTQGKGLIELLDEGLRGKGRGH